MKATMRSRRAFTGLAALFALGAGEAPASGADCTPLPQSNAGCEFYAVTLPNTQLDQIAFSFGVDLLNAGNASVQVAIDGGGLVTPDNFAVGVITGSRRVGRTRQGAVDCQPVADGVPSEGAGRRERAIARSARACCSDALDCACAS